MLNDKFPDWIRKALDEHFNELAKLAGEHNEIQLLRQKLDEITSKLKSELTSEQLLLILEWEEAVNYQHAVEKEWLYCLSPV